MPRKPMEVVQINLRIRENLRRRVEQSAKKRGVSLNFEMTSRLQETFDRVELLTISKAAADLETVAQRFEHFAEETRDRVLQEDLMEAAEVLIDRLPAEIRERAAIKAAVEEVQKAIKAIAMRVGRMSLEEPGD